VTAHRPLVLAPRSGLAHDDRPEGRPSCRNALRFAQRTRSEACRNLVQAFETAPTRFVHPQSLSADGCEAGPYVSSRWGPDVERGPAPKPDWRKVGYRKRGAVLLPPQLEEDLEVNDQPSPTGEMLARRLKARASVIWRRETQRPPRVDGTAAVWPGVTPRRPGGAETSEGVGRDAPSDRCRSSTPSGRIGLAEQLSDR
jgi:hypothetical protein